MKKGIYLAEKVFYIVMIPCVTFILRPMTLQVTDFGWFVNQPFPWGAWISRVFIFLITAFVLALFFKAKASVKSFLAFFRVFFKQCLWMIILLRLIADGLEFSLRIQPTLPGEIGVLLVETGFLVAMFWVFRKAFMPKPKRMSNKRKRFVWAGVFTALAVAAYSICLTNIHLQTVVNETAKYTDTAYMLDPSATGFPLEIVTVLYLIVLWVLQFSAFGLIDGALPSKYGWRTFTARLLVAVFLMIPFMFVNLLVLPYEMINTVNRRSSGSTYSSEIRMDITSARWTISRLTGYSVDEPVYLVNKKTIVYGRETLLTLKVSPNSAKGELEWIFVNGVDESYHCGNDAIAYLHEGTPFAIATKDINAYQTKNDCLLAICKQMVQEHNFEMLEYSYEYLLRYDSEFLQTYLADTKVDDGYYFQNFHIQESYIKTVWEKILDVRI